jgi:cytochrome c oxidase subunit III
MVVAAPTAPTDGEPADASRGPTALTVGVIVWLASELMFFSGLFAAWFTLRASTKPWPPDGVELATVTTTIATLVLLGSSVTMHVAHGAAVRGERGTAVRWLAVTGLLGVVFLANLAWEWDEATFRISTNAYGSMFFLMTGFHGLHVIGGLAFMGAVAWTVSGRGSRAPLHSSVEVCAYYWHFVDVMWVAMFLTIYVLR